MLHHKAPDIAALDNQRSIVLIISSPRRFLWISQCVNVGIRFDTSGIYQACR
jgi:hypothetical protein